MHRPPTPLPLRIPEGLVHLTLVLGLLASPAALAEADTFGLGTGRDGALNVTTATTAVNDEAQITAVSGAIVTVATGQGSTFASGNLVLLWRVKGLSVAEAPSASQATVNLQASDVGRWELARVASVAGDQITLTNPIAAPTAFASNSQLVRVPEYTTVTITSAGSLVPRRTWDGTRGGVVAFLATGAVQNAGSISATGYGFRGGARGLGLGGDACPVTNVDQSAPNGSGKGEGLVTGGATNGRGNLANGAGGGNGSTTGANCHDTGGGGGGNAGAGGKGGRSVWDAVDLGGFGGAAITYSLDDRLVFGGGGGGGKDTNEVGTNGAAGGGVVFVRAQQFSATGTVRADGGVAGTAGLDGAGGGGAGGVVLLRVVQGATCGAISVAGGRGGNQEHETVHGPGGGGGGGSIWLQNPNGATSCAVSVAPGASGVSTGTNVYTYPGFTTANDARAGSAGLSRVEATAYPGTACSTIQGLCGGCVSSAECPAPATCSATAHRCALAPPVPRTPADGVLVNVARPALSGDGAPANAPVVVLVDGAVVTTVTADAQGRWSYTPTVDLSLGEHRFAARTSIGSGPTLVTSTDSAANRFTLVTGCLANTDCSGTTPLCRVSDRKCVTCLANANCSGARPACDTAAGVCERCVVNADCPSPAVCSSVHSCDLPALVVATPANGAVTNDPTPILSGTGAPPNATVTVLLDGSSVGTTTAAADGRWSLEAPLTLAPGSYVVTARSTVGSGVLAVTTPASNAPRFTVIDGCLADADCAGATPACETTTNRCVRCITNTQCPSPATCTASRTCALPALVVTTPASITNDPTPTLGGSGAPSGATVTVTLDGSVIGTTLARADGSWSLDAPITVTPGTHTASASATIGAAPLAVTTPPSNTLSFTVIDGCLSNQDCSGSKPVCRTSDHACVTCLSNTDCSGATPACDVAATTCVRCVTNAECPSPATCSATHACVLTPPVLEVPAEGALTNDHTPTISGRGAPAGALVTITIDGATAGTTTADLQGRFTFEPSTPLTAGNHVASASVSVGTGSLAVAATAADRRFVVIDGCLASSECTGATPACDTTAHACVRCVLASDCPGNATCSATHACVLAAPRVDTPAEGSRSANALPVITGTGAAPNGSVALTLDGRPLAVVTADGGGRFTYTPVTPFAPGPHVLTATTTAGTGALAITSAPSDPRAFTILDENALDDDGDGVSDAAEKPNGVARDTDGDGKADWQDSDDDGDGLPTRDERLGGLDLDTDGDGTPDRLDADDDADGLLTRVERDDATTRGADVDADGRPNWLDTDSDADGASDLVEGRGDANGNGIPNYLDPLAPIVDTDADGLPDTIEKPSGTEPDTDRDGVPDWKDPDDDGDGILTAIELADDTTTGDDGDRDGLMSPRDTDSDGDGLPDALERRDDPDSDGLPAYLDRDSDGDGLDDADERDGDTDGDTHPDRLDPDDDGDGLSTRDELADGSNFGNDPDADRVSNWLDFDSDGDGASDLVEGRADVDGDGRPEYLDPGSDLADTDDDGLPDTLEKPDGVERDTDQDGTPDWKDPDDDGDGLPTRTELADDASPGHDLDTDGLPSPLDTDSDGDGVLDSLEKQADPDRDGEGAYLDRDSDGDGVTDRLESPGGNDRDTDHDAVPDRLDPDDDGDAITTAAEIADGANFGDDPDGDGKANPLDDDSDGDGASDLSEARTDTNHNGIPDYLDPDTTVADTDGDGVSDPVEKPGGVEIDTDRDGKPDWKDDDDDDDGLPTRTEHIADRTPGGDTDGDGLPSWRDPDADGDGITDRDEGLADPDADGLGNWLDVDSDGDTWLDSTENTGDSDLDGLPDRLDTDDDGDGIPTARELALDTSAGNDRDADGTASPLDTDSDGDGALDLDEGTRDVDEDGTPGFLDLDDDGDGIPTARELADDPTTDDDFDADGLPSNEDTDADGDGKLDAVEGTGDADANGAPDYLDIGGAIALVGGCTQASATWGALVALGLVAVRRRRGRT